ncbi:MAG: T9SS type A sorting domain-containing protein, partial [Saprospiraceae bacterium]
DTSGSILAGEILTEHGVPVGHVKVTLTSPGQIFPSYVTNADGKFRFDHLSPGANYTITPERDDNHKNGVSTLDLVRIQKHLLGLLDFTSPYQYIAADANNSNSVSAIDLVELRKLILGIYTVLPNSKSWTFVDKKYTMQNPAHPWPYAGSIHMEALQGRITDNDFIAVKVGDVNNTAQANALQVLPRGGRKVMTIKASAPEMVEVGQTIEMKLILPDDVSGFQWTFETDGLEYAGISSDDIQIGDENIGVPENGIVTMSWNGSTNSPPVINQGPVIALRWKVLTQGKLSKMIRMSSKVTSAESYTAMDEIMNVKLSFLHDQGQAEFGLYQNKPNPWNGQTLIGFELPADDHARLTIYDVSGKTLKTIEGEYKAGYNSIELTEKDIPTAGVLYYRLESSGNSASKKMIILR